MMPHHRIRVVKLDERFGGGSDYPYAVQLSPDGLIWATLGRFKSFEEALDPAKAFSEFINNNMLIKPTVILWTNKK